MHWPKLTSLGLPVYWELNTVAYATRQPDVGPAIPQQMVSDAVQAPHNLLRSTFAVVLCGGLHGLGDSKLLCYTMLHQ